MKVKEGQTRLGAVRRELFDAMGACGLTLLIALAVFAPRVHAQEAGPSLHSEEAQTPAAGTPASPDKTGKQDSSEWQIRIYPIYAWVPIQGVDVTLPSLPEGGSGSGLFNGAAFAAFEVEKGRWSGNVSFLWAGLSAEREVPSLKVSTDLIYGQALGGYEIVRDLSLVVGARHMALDISIEVETLPEFKRKPGFWDPLIGLTYQKRLGEKWRLRVHADGGGFGVGSDVSVGANVVAAWQFARRFNLVLGYGVLYFKVSDTVAQETLDFDTTLYGPTIGVGIRVGKIKSSSGHQ